MVAMHGHMQAGVYLGHLALGVERVQEASCCAGCTGGDILHVIQVNLDWSTLARLLQSAGRNRQSNSDHIAVDCGSHHRPL